MTFLDPMSGEAATRKVGDHRLPCPVCDKGPKDTSVWMTIKGDGFWSWHCFRCGSSGWGKPEGSRTTAPQRPIERRKLASSVRGVAAWARAIWNASQPLAGDAVQYLQARRCVIPPGGGDLRWHPTVRHPSGHLGPALVARITDAATSAPISLHRTWIRPNGRKAEVQPARLYAKGHRKAGGVVRLWPNEEVTLGVGIAEGIETALSAAHAFRPVWACLDAGNVAAFPVLAGVESLTVFADHDPAGCAAALECVARWREAGREAQIVLPELEGADANDLIARAARWTGC